MIDLDNNVDWTTDVRRVGRAHRNRTRAERPIAVVALVALGFRLVAAPLAGRRHVRRADT